MAANVVVRWMESGGLRFGDLSSLADARRAGAPVWVDVTDPDAAAMAALQAEFCLHPLAIEDCLHFPQRVKIDLYPEAAFMVWDFPRLTDGTDIVHAELDAFLGDGFLITSHRDRIHVVDEVGADVGPALGRGVPWILHSLLDRGVDDLFPIVDQLADELDQLEDSLLESPRESDLQRLHAIKRRLVSIYRVVAAERDVLRTMARREEFVDADSYLYFQDVGDHLARAVDAIDTYRDVASGAMDIYLSAVNNRMNAIMKQLTVVATIFMPLTLISGIYGMNVLGPSGAPGMWPPPDAFWSFGAIIAAMVGIALGMLWFFRRRSWW